MVKAINKKSQMRSTSVLSPPSRHVQLRITTLDPVVVVVMLLLVFLDECLIFLSHFSKVNVVYSCVGCRMSLCSDGYEKEEWICG